MELLSDNFIEFEKDKGSSIPIKQFIELAHTIVKSKTILLFGALPYRESEIMNSNTTQLVKLGWTWDIDLDEGIKRIKDQLSAM